MGGGGSWSSSRDCEDDDGTSASIKESVDLVLMRRGARRRRLLGVQGSPAWALCDGETVAPSANQGGICTGAMGSRSGMKAGFSIPAPGL